MRTSRSTVAWGFDGHDRRRLARALAGCREVRAYRRLQAVMLVASGVSVSRAARLACAGWRAVHRWVEVYLGSRRVADLYDAPRSGRPPASGRITDARIVREYGRDPLRLGHMATEWTVPLLATHLSGRYGCAITPRTLRRRMKALGLAWKRPRHAYGDEKDPHGAQKKGRSSAA